MTSWPHRVDLSGQKSRAEAYPDEPEILFLTNLTRLTADLRDLRDPSKIARLVAGRAGRRANGNSRLAL